MAILRNNNEALYIPYIHAVYDTSQNGMLTAEYKEIFEVQKARYAVEEEAATTGFIVAPNKTEGANYNYDTAHQLYTSRYVIQTYALGFEVTQEAIEDSVAYNIIDRLIPALKKSMNVAKETVCANILNNAFNNAYKGGDGVSLINSNHPTATFAQSNQLATPADLSYTSMWDMITQIQQSVDDKGKVAPLLPKKLIIPVGLHREAETILKTVGAPGTADNDINALASTGMVKGGYAINHYLKDQTNWFMITDATDGLKLFEKVSMELETTAPNYSNGNISVRARERYVPGWSNWRGVFGSVGA